MCLEQLKSKWLEHPLYSAELHRFWGYAVSTAKSGAQNRGLVFNIDKEYALGLYLEQNGRCALSGIKLIPEFGAGAKNHVKPSLDRINSAKGYTHTNVQVVAAIVNIMKNDMPQDEFIRWCNRVAQVQASKEDELLQAI